MPALRLTRKSGDLSGRKTDGIFKRTARKARLVFGKEGGHTVPSSLAILWGRHVSCPPLAISVLCLRPRGQSQLGWLWAAPPQTYGLAHTSGAGFAVQWTGRRRGQDVNPVPRRRHGQLTAKIRAVIGWKNRRSDSFKGGDFLNIRISKNTTRPLTARIGEADVGATSFRFMTHIPLQGFLFAPERSAVKLHKHIYGFKPFFKIEMLSKCENALFFCAEWRKIFALNYHRNFNAKKDCEIALFSVCPTSGHFGPKWRSAIHYDSIFRNTVSVLPGMVTVCLNGSNPYFSYSPTWLLIRYAAPNPSERT